VDAWSLLLAAARVAGQITPASQSAAFALANDGELRQVSSGAPGAQLVWRADGWTSLLPADDPNGAFLDLYLPICGATRARPITVGHLGQSLDGFIATHSGDSQYVTGEENILHLHRMRALCDAIIVGAGTVAADDPRLTTRHVEGSNPLRVVLDPTRRLAEHYHVFNDSPETLYVCARSQVKPGESHFGRAEVVAIDDTESGIDVTALLKLLRQRGCVRIFVEGGGVTVSNFLEANLLDRLQIAIAPLIIGDGKPAIRLEPPDALRDCHRPRYRVFRMGGDVLFDCDLRSPADEQPPDMKPPVSRII
jgi:diaminohydroxyphosphoribosylaminopyrimidine deaminase / 5-amino-6-(5-phosphoribosylamino)uracil reductase